MSAKTLFSTSKESPYSSNTTRDEKTERGLPARVLGRGLAGWKPAIRLFSDEVSARPPRKKLVLKLVPYLQPHHENTR